MDINKIKKLVKEYEQSSGIEAQNFRQLEVLTPEKVSDALNADIIWHIDNTQELVTPLEKALNYCIK